jgi:hypothetical protein
MVRRDGNTGWSGGRFDHRESLALIELFGHERRVLVAREDAQPQVGECLPDEHSRSVSLTKGWSGERFDHRVASASASGGELLPTRVS